MDVPTWPTLECWIGNAGWGGPLKVKLVKTLIHLEHAALNGHLVSALSINQVSKRWFAVLEYRILDNQPWLPLQLYRTSILPIQRVKLWVQDSDLGHLIDGKEADIDQCRCWISKHYVHCNALIKSCLTIQDREAMRDTAASGVQKWDVPEKGQCLDQGHDVHPALVLDELWLRDSDLRLLIGKDARGVVAIVSDERALSAVEGSSLQDLDGTLLNASVVPKWPLCDVCRGGRLHQ